MNRAHHLKRTLPQNILDNTDYSNVEFIIVDYNSSDGLEEWVKSDLMDYIHSGKLIYYRTTDPQYFNRSHSRNMSFNLATGNILCNVDADNYTGPGFAAHLNERFNQEQNIFLTIDIYNKLIYDEYKDSFGRLCVRKEDYLAINGYDEEMAGYGHEDQDIFARLELLGREKKFISKLEFLHSISHSAEERFQEEFFGREIHSVYIAYIEQSKSTLLFLYKKGGFESGTIVPSRYDLFAPAALQKDSWDSGSWFLSGNDVILNYHDSSPKTLVQEDNQYHIDNIPYELITNENLLSKIKLYYPLIANAKKHQLNKERKELTPNKGLFGQGTVFKNFNNQVPMNVI